MEIDGRIYRCCGVWDPWLLISNILYTVHLPSHIRVARRAAERVVVKARLKYKVEFIRNVCLREGDEEGVVPSCQSCRILLNTLTMPSLCEPEEVDAMQSRTLRLC